MLEKQFGCKKNRTILMGRVYAMLGIFLCGVGLNFYSPCFAAPQLPSVVGEGIVSSVEQDKEKREQYLLEKEPAEKVGIEDEKESGAEEKLGKESIYIKGFIFEGDVLFSEAELQGIVKYATNKNSTMEMLKNVTKKITNYYRQKGYIVTRAYIPLQNMEDGMLKVEIVVGRYDKIVIQKNIKLSDWLVQRELGQVKQGAYITQHNLDEAILLLDGISGVEARAELKKGDVSGTSTLGVVLSKEKNEETLVSFDNYGSRYTGRGEFPIMANWLNVTGRGDNLMLNGLTTNAQMYNGGFSYSTPFGGSPGAKFSVSYAQSFYVLGDVYTPLNYSGHSRIYSAAWSMPTLRSREANDYFSVSYNNKYYDNYIASQDYQTGLKRTQLVSATWNGDFYDNKLSTTSYNTYNLTLSGGYLSIYTPDDVLYDKLTVQTAGFFGKLTCDYSRWQGINNRLSAYFHFSGQLAGKNLTASEKFNLTGPYAVRAYPSSEVMGDQGFVATLELWWRMPNKKLPGNFTWAVFVDSGQTEFNKENHWNIANDTGRQALGTGIMWNDSENGCSVRLDYAWHWNSPASNVYPNENGMFLCRVTKVF